MSDQPEQEIRVGGWKGAWIFGALVFMAGSVTMCSSGETLKTTIIGAALSIVGCLWIIIAELMQCREQSKDRDSE
jgi:hypothetical protein